MKRQPLCRFLSDSREPDQFADQTAQQSFLITRSDPQHGRCLHEAGQIESAGQRFEFISHHLARFADGLVRSGQCQIL